MNAKRLILLVIGTLCSTGAMAAPIFSASVSQLPQGQSVEVVLTIDPNGSPVDAFELFFSVPPSGLSISGLVYGSSNFVGQDVTGGIFGATFAAAAALTTPFELARFTVQGDTLGAQLKWDDSGTNFIDSASGRTTFSGTVATVVPEPGSLLLTAAGLTILGRRRRFRTQQRKALPIVG